MRIGLIGGVSSTMATLIKLLEHNIDIRCVYGYKPSEYMVVSSHVDMSDLCLKNSIDFFSFTRINEKLDSIKNFNLDVIFVVGLSQIVSRKIIESAKIGVVGFHPTLLPRGRGRAPISWLVSEVENGAATFFLLTDEPDKGPIFIQSEFNVNIDDDAESVENKMIHSIGHALDDWLPDLKKGIWDPIPQNEYSSTEYGVRKPNDGLINWQDSAKKINRLIKASSYPHPGAFTFLGMEKITILKCDIESNIPIKGVVGRVLLYDSNKGFLIQCGEGLLWITSLDGCVSQLRIGKKFGFYSELEIYKLWKEVCRIGNKKK